METLAPHQRKKGHPLAKAGITKPEYHFLQTICLLEERNPEYASIGVESDPTRELIRFAGSYDFGFPAADLQMIEKGEANENPVQLKLNLLPLGGACGPLPIPYSRLVLERYRQKDRGISQFLNIFQHRLISLLYRALRHHLPALDGQTVEEEHFASHTLSILGLGMKQLRSRISVPDRTMIGFSSIFLSGSRSSQGLEQLLTRFFETNIRLQPFSGEWNRIPERLRTTIGSQGENNTLGTTFVLGSKAWLDQAGFLITADSLTLTMYAELLPGGAAHQSLKDLVRLYVGDEYDYTMEISLTPAELPASMLGQPMEPAVERNAQVVNRPRLGWDFYLKTTTTPPPQTPTARFNLNDLA